MGKVDEVGVGVNRQTTRPVLHPQLGMGILTYRNGPAWFCSSTGVREDYAEVGLDGWSKDEGVTLRVSTSTETTKLKCCGPSSPLHKRVMLYDGRRGWLVWTNGSTLDDAEPFRHPEVRFEPDDGGEPTSIGLCRMVMGPPGAAKRYSRRKPPRDLPHELYWSTYTGTDGSQLVFCLEADAERVSWPKRDRPGFQPVGTTATA